MSKLLGLLVGTALLGSVSVASAAEPVYLNDSEMDQVSAGAVVNVNAVIQSARARARVTNFGDANAFLGINGGITNAAAAEAKNVAIINTSRSVNID